MGILRPTIGAAVLALALAASAAAQQPARWEIAGQFAALDADSTTLAGGGISAWPGFGVSASARIWRSLSATASFDFFPQFSYPSNVDGGRMSEGLAGLRWQFWRWRRLGFYAEARPGFVSFNHVIIGMHPGPCCDFIDGRLTDFALNFGGGVTYYTSPHTALRLDLGDTEVDNYDPVTRAYGGPRHWLHRFQLSTGIVLRF